VDGVVVDVAEDGAGSQPVRAVLAVDVLAQLVHNLGCKTQVVVLRFAILEDAGKLQYIFFAGSFTDPSRPSTKQILLYILTEQFGRHQPLLYRVPVL
jgi:hypothetical protein